MPGQCAACCLNNVLLDSVNNFKCLWCIVTADLGDHADLERERRAVSRRANMMIRAVFR